jgi:hypothetical protein
MCERNEWTIECKNRIVPSFKFLTSGRFKVATMVYLRDSIYTVDKGAMISHKYLSVK